VEKGNQEIAIASKGGEAWPQQAVLVALKLTGEGLRGHTKIIEVQTPPEQRDAATITVTESGYLDDAIGGVAPLAPKERQRRLDHPAGSLGSVV